MAEAFGLAVNIAAVLQLAVQITQLSYSYARDVKNAPKVQKEYLQEVSSLMEVLFRVEQAMVDTEKTGLLPARPPALSDDVLLDCYKSLSKLHFELQKRRSRLLQPFHEPEWKQHIEMLHRYRSHFADYLTSCIVVTGNATYQKVASLNQEQDRSLLLTWLPSSTASMRQRPSPCPGTGGWFLANQSVQQWVDGSSPFLWCYGPPGAGKSYLASVVIDHLVAKRAQNDCPLMCFFCDFSSQDQQTTLDILTNLLRQLIQQGSGELLAILKESCDDPAKLHNANEVAQLILKAGSVQRIHLILDAVDELKDPNGLLAHISSFASRGIKVLVTSRDLPHVRKRMNSATHLSVESSSEDLTLYVEERFRNSDFWDDVEDDHRLITDIVSKSGNLFLLARLMLDDMLELATINQIRKALGKQQASLEQAFEATMKRIDAQSKARSSLARRLLRWITYAKRRLRLDEVLHAFALDDGDVDLQQDNIPSADLLLRACVGLVVVDPGDNTLGLVHTTAYEFLRDGKFSEHDTNMDMAKTSLQYLTMNCLSGGPCQSWVQLSERFRQLTFLDYAAKHWGHHISSADDERQLETLIMKLLRDDKLRNSAFQALQYRQEWTYDASLAEKMLQSLPTNQKGLLLAAYWNLTHTSELLLADGENVSAADSHKWTPLHWACSQNHVGVAELLVGNSADLNAQDMQGWTPLFWAAFIGNPELVSLLLANGANHLSKSTLGWTALHWAISGGNSGVVKELLRHHSRTSAVEPVLYTMTMEEIVSYAENTVPVKIAAESQDTEIFNLLVEHLETPTESIGNAKFNLIWSSEGFDAPASRNPWRTLTKAQYAMHESPIPRLTGQDAEDSTGYREDPSTWRSVLMLSAIRDQQLASMQLLVKAGADVEYKNALCVAARQSDPRYVQYLLANGANPNAVSTGGRTALHEAVLGGFLGTIAALIEGGADVNQPLAGGRYWVDEETPPQQPYRGLTPLMLGCGFILGGSPEIALSISRLLLSKGADAQLRDDRGKTVLHYAVSRPYLPLITLLIDAGCPVDMTDTIGRMPIHYLATCSGDSDILKETVRLMITAERTNSSGDIVPTMDVNLLNWPVQDGLLDSEGEECLDSGGTPISIALQMGSWKMARILYDYGARLPNDLDFVEILSTAIRDLAADVVTLLLGHGTRPPRYAVLTLVRSLACHLWDDKPPADGIFDKFKCIVTSIATVGADVNDRASEEEDTALTTAIRSPGSFTIIKDLLSVGADVYATTDTTFDPIITAAVYGNTEALRDLLRYAVAHSNPQHWSRYLNEVRDETQDDFMWLCSSLQQADALNRTNKAGATLLHLAAQNGNVPLITALLRHGAKADITDGDGLLPLHRAGLEHQTAALCTLLPLPSDTSSKQPGGLLDDEDKQFWLEALYWEDPFENTILDVAIRVNNVALTEHLLQYGVDPNCPFSGSRTYYNESMLCYAAVRGFSDLLSVLIDYGANIEAANDCGWRPLHFACYKGNTEAAAALINAGSDIHATTTKWRWVIRSDRLPFEATPLHLAALSGNPDTVQLLLDKGADIHAVTGEKGNVYLPYWGTALEAALVPGPLIGFQGEALDEDRLRIAELLISRGAMVEGVLPQLSLEDVLKFRDFPGLWDALRAAELRAEEKGASES